MNTPTCANCRFFLPDDFGNDTCRRRSPVSVFDGRTLATVWPIVTPAHWCGDHRLPDLPPAPSPLPTDGGAGPFP